MAEKCRFVILLKKGGSVPVDDVTEEEAKQEARKFIPFGVLEIRKRTENGTEFVEF